MPHYLMCLTMMRTRTLVLALFCMLFSSFPVLVIAEEQTFIAGVIFLDNNGNKVQDLGEPILPNRLVWLNTPDGFVENTMTNAEGIFGFAIETLGTYSIQIELEGMRLTTPFFAEMVMPPHPVEVTEKGKTVQVDFGLSDGGNALFENRDNSVIIHDQQYGVRVSPKMGADKVTELSEMTVEQLEAETFIGQNNTSEVFLSPSTSGGRVARNGDEEFTVIVGRNVSATGQEEVFTATPNPNNSLTLVNQNRPTTQITLDDNGNYTVTDTEFPDQVVTNDSDGNLVISDVEFPDMGLVITPDGIQTVVNSEFPGVALTLNEDGTYTITDTDEEFSNLIAVYDPEQESYVISDTANNLTILIDQAGNHTIIDDTNNVCVTLPEQRFLKSLWKKVKSFFHKVAKFVAKIAGFVKKVAKFVKKILPVAIVALKAISAVTAFLAPIFPPLCPVLCAISAFSAKMAGILTKVKPFLDKAISIAGKVETGANAVAAFTAPKKDERRKSRNLSTRLPREGERADCTPPPALVLDYIIGAAHETHNELNWATIAEFGNQGFNLWRAEKNAAGELINLIQINDSLILSQSNTQWGATYQFKDTTVMPNTTYYYFVESVDNGGISTQQTEEIAEVKTIANDGYMLACGVYGVHDEALNDSYFFTYDFLQGTTHPIGDVCQGCDIESMTINPVTYEIFVASGDNASGHPKGYLYKFEPETQTLIPVGDTGFAGITSLAFDRNGNLFGWAENTGLVQINELTGEATLITASAVDVGDLAWHPTSSLLYGSLGTQLWQYDSASNDAALICENLPSKTEALALLPPAIASNHLLLGSHQTGFQLIAFNVANCAADMTHDIQIPFNDVEGFAVSDFDCAVNQ